MITSIFLSQSHPSQRWEAVEAALPCPLSRDTGSERDNVRLSVRDSTLSLSLNHLNMSFKKAYGMVNDDKLASGEQFSFQQQ